LSILAVTFSVPVRAAQDGFNTRSTSGWFDFEDCTFCQTISDNPALLAHTTWENHAISNGMMNIMTVEPAYAAAMARAVARMQELGQEIQSGEVDKQALKLCGHCQSFEALLQDGVAMEEVRGEAAVVSLFTADDPALVKRLQEQAARDTREMKLLKGGPDQP
jgi:hypothetical protein